MAHIEYFFATTSPFTYLAGTRMEAVAAKHGATITYRPLDIIALFSRTGGTAPKDRHPARLEYRLQELRRLSKKHGLPMNLDPPFRAVNPAPSSYAFIAAAKAGGAIWGRWSMPSPAPSGATCAISPRMTKSRACLEEAGFDPGLAGMGMLAGAEEYTRNLEDAVNAGAFGAPFYIVDGTERFWGQDRIDDLDLHLSGGL
jgi:2-hydroxychromene-2-carboxylate isomerase